MSLQPIRFRITILLCSLIVLHTSLALADDLAPLSDEFSNASTFSKWQDLGVVEGWTTPSYEIADINTSEPGHFHLVPGPNTWFAHLRGLLMFKEVTGDFVVTAKFRVLSRHNAADPTEVPNRSFSLTGIFIHGPRNITQAAPDPYRTDAVWPPGDFGSDYVENTENYIFLSYGSAGNPGTRQFEIKATRNSSSQLYFDSTGIDQNETEVWLQLVRVGDTVVCLRKHGESEPWIVENRYPNAVHHFPVFGDTLQVGITAYTDWETAAPFNAGGLQTSYHFNYAPPTDGMPDLISQVDYFRFRRPDPALTELVLQGMSTSFNPATNTTAATPVELSESLNAAPYLGDNANIEYAPYTDWATIEFGGNPDSPDAQPTADPDGDGLSNLLEFALGSDPESIIDTMVPVGSLSGGDYTYQFTPSITDGADLIIQSVSDLSGTWQPVASRPLEGGDWIIHDGDAAIQVNETTDEVTLTLPATDPQSFFRLQVSQ
ncbi:MAG: hypothetical protein AAF571_04410 [Verrucomicrobiota bacterium]